MKFPKYLHTFSFAILRYYVTILLPDSPYRIKLLAYQFTSSQIEEENVFGYLYLSMYVKCSKRLNVILMHTIFIFSTFQCMLEHTNTRTYTYTHNCLFPTEAHIYICIVSKHSTPGLNKE